MTAINVGLLKSNIEELVNQRGESKTKVFINSGVGKDFFSNLNKGQIPSVEKIISLAEYLDVSVDYLLGREEKSTTNINTANNSKIANSTVIGVNKGKQYDETTNQVAEMFSNMNIKNKTKVLNLMIELSEKEGA